MLNAIQAKEKNEEISNWKEDVDIRFLLKLAFGSIKVKTSPPPWTRAEKLNAKWWRDGSVSTSAL